MKNFPRKQDSATAKELFLPRLCVTNHLLHYNQRHVERPAIPPQPPPPTESLISLIPILVAAAALQYELMMTNSRQFFNEF